MKTEITFYQIDESLVKALAPLLLKMIDEKKKVLIFCSDQSKIQEIDGALWGYGRNKFIPHTTIFDKEFSLRRQPILISNCEENSNEADYLIFLDEVSEAFLSSFSRVFYFFGSEKSSTALDLAKKLKPKNFYEKRDGKWVSVGRG